MSVKQAVHKCSLLIKKKIFVKCIVKMHITAELKAYWLTYLIYIHHSAV